MHRRDALRALAASAGLHWLDRMDLDQIIRLGERLHARARLAPGQGAGVLGERLQEIVMIAAERIIPASDTPGATDAGVTAFIERMLAEWYDAAERDRLLAGLADLNARGRTRHGRDFAALGGSEQIALMTMLDSEAAAARRIPPAERGGAPEHWFSTFKFLVVWGYCTSEVGMRETLGEWPLAGRYDGCAPYEATETRRR